MLTYPISHIRVAVRVHAPLSNCSTIEGVDDFIIELLPLGYIKKDTVIVKNSTAFKLQKSTTGTDMINGQAEECCAGRPRMKKKENTAYVYKNINND